MIIVLYFLRSSSRYEYLFFIHRCNICIIFYFSAVCILLPIPVLQLGIILPSLLILLHSLSKCFTFHSYLLFFPLLDDFLPPFFPPHAIIINF
nr:MAG TPA: hypothetical protein [Caudoviricetes sp.]